MNDEYRIVNTIKKVVGWFNAPWKIYSLIVLIILLLFLGYYFRSKIDAAVEKYYQHRFDKKISKQEQDIKKLSDENSKLLTDIKIIIAQGDAKDLQIDMLNKELEKYGKEARKAIELQEQAQKEFERDQANIAIDIPLYQRCLNLCSERAEVNYPCKAGFCDRYK